MLNPASAEAHFNLGNAYLKKGDWVASVVAFRAAAAIDPSKASFVGNLGLALHKSGNTAAARDAYSKALRIDPATPNVYNNLGHLLRETGDVDGAISAFRQAIQLHPGYGNAHMNLALTMLREGNLAEGLKEYEWRWESAGFEKRKWNIPIWRGESLAGKRLIIQCEQGLGDTIQFIRFFSNIADRADVLVDVPSPLISLMRSTLGVDAILQNEALAAGFDFQVGLLSLPLILGIDVPGIPGTTPYLKVPQKQVAQWSGYLEPRRELRVGLVWSGGEQFVENARRSIPLEEFQAIINIHGVKFYSLQLGSAQSQLARIGWADQVHDLSPRLKDFSDTAAILQKLDLLISVDTSVAHLAGALACPVWLLIGCHADWRWFLHRTDSPWYPTMRLFRQSQFGVWADVMCELVEALSRLKSDQIVGGE